MAKRKCVLTEFEKRKAAFSISSVVCLDYATHPVTGVSDKELLDLVLASINAENVNGKYFFVQTPNAFHLCMEFGKEAQHTASLDISSDKPITKEMCEKLCSGRLLKRKPLGEISDEMLNRNKFKTGLDKAKLNKVKRNKQFLEGSFDLSKEVLDVEGQIETLNDDEEEEERVSALRKLKESMLIGPPSVSSLDWPVVKEEVYFLYVSKREDEEKVFLGKISPESGPESVRELCSLKKAQSGEFDLPKHFDETKFIDIRNIGDNLKIDSESGFREIAAKNEGILSWAGIVSLEGVQPDDLIESIKDSVNAQKLQEGKHFFIVATQEYYHFVHPTEKGLEVHSSLDKKSVENGSASINDVYGELNKNDLFLLPVEELVDVYNRSPSGKSCEL